MLREEEEAVRLVIQCFNETIPAPKQILQMALRAVHMLTPSANYVMFGAKKIVDAGLSSIDGLGSSGLVSARQFSKYLKNNTAAAPVSLTGLDRADLKELGYKLQEHHIAAYIGYDNGKRNLYFAAKDAEIISHGLRLVSEKYLTESEIKATEVNYPHITDSVTPRPFADKEGRVWNPIENERGSFTTTLRFDDGCRADVIARDNGSYQASYFDASGNFLFDRKAEESKLSNNLGSALNLAVSSCVESPLKEMSLQAEKKNREEIPMILPKKSQDVISSAQKASLRRINKAHKSSKKNVSARMKLGR